MSFSSDRKRNLTLSMCIVSQFCLNPTAACSAAALKSGVFTPAVAQGAWSTSDMEAESWVFLKRLAGASTFLQEATSTEVLLILVGV